MTGFPYLTALTLTPLIGAAVVAGMDSQNAKLIRRMTFAFTVAAALLVAGIWSAFDPLDRSLQLPERHSWIPTLGIEYFLGLDGLGLVLVVLTALVTPMAVMAAPPVQDKPQIYYGLILFLQAGLFGAFTALNFFHWFIFWELSLIPAFFLIKLWGGPNRGRAATQFFVYTMVGSVTMLLAFLALFVATKTFDFVRLAELAKSGKLQAMVETGVGWHALMPDQLMLLLFFGVFLGFAVKVPLFPFHTWLPSTYAEAPTPVTMLLTGVMSKMGVYGFLRILLPIFPEQLRQVLTPLLWLAVGTIVFSAFAAFAQREIKRMLAYSSINHLGYCVLGVLAAATTELAPAKLAVEQAVVLNGVVLQMFNHGLTAATLFCLVGFLEQRSGGQRDLGAFGGLRAVAPVFCGVMGISLFASLGLPGLNGFVGEFLIFKGALSLVNWAAVLSAVGLLVTAVFLLTLMQRVFAGPLNPAWKTLPDLSRREKWLVLPATGLMFLIGIYPQLLIEFINPTVLGWLR
jgi:NADH-quinone oxidoreductase subunit M